MWRHVRMVASPPIETSNLRVCLVCCFLQGPTPSPTTALHDTSDRSHDSIACSKVCVHQRSQGDGESTGAKVAIGASHIKTQRQRRMGVVKDCRPRSTMDQGHVDAIPVPSGPGPGSCQRSRRRRYGQKERFSSVLLPSMLTPPARTCRPRSPYML